MQIIEGNLTVNNNSIAIVVSRFNEFINSKLLEGAKDCLVRHGANVDNIKIVWVPGAFEIPLAAQTIAKTNKFDSIICLGTVIRGSTAHFEYVSSSVTKGIAEVSLKYDLPVIFGVLTTDTIEQAVERAGTKAGNKGWEAALSSIEMMNLMEKLKEI